MISESEKKKFYKALLEKNSKYLGIFFAGIKTTGIFCKPTCTARKPKYKNCEFFKTAEEALLASFRPCLRCKPLSIEEQSDVINKLVDLVEKNPQKRWKEFDFKKLGFDTSTVRRHFKKNFGMTFIEYARSRRLGLAFKEIRDGKKIIDSQLNARYESSSGFRDAFSKIMGQSPSKSHKTSILLKSNFIDTKLGKMIVIASDEYLYLLEFYDRRALETEISKIRNKHNAAIIPGNNKIIVMVKKELNLYFSGKLKNFTVPIFMDGSEFQKKAWHELIKIPYGETRSYLEQAKKIGNEKAFRAVANANGKNQIAIIIPCHRIINSNGDLGGYGGGIERKKWLLEHESNALF